MDGVTIVESADFQELVSEIKSLRNTVDLLKEAVLDARKPYLNTKEVCDLLDKSENWVLLHKSGLGYSKRTGTLLFKRKVIEEYVEEDFFRKTSSRLLPPGKDRY